MCRIRTRNCFIKTCDCDTTVKSKKIHSLNYSIYLIRYNTDRRVVKNADGLDMILGDLKGSTNDKTMVK